MASKEFTYTKISELPDIATLKESDIFIVNQDGTTSKTTLTKIAEHISTLITNDIEELNKEIQTLKSNYSTLSTTVQEQDETINNIITAGFNLIGKG